MDTKQLPDVLKAIEQNTAITANTISLKFAEYDKINDRQDESIKKLNDVAFSNVREIEILKTKAGIFK